MLKSYGVGWWGGVVAHENLVSAEGPLVLGFGVLGPGLDNYYFSGFGLTLKSHGPPPTTPPYNF